MVKQKPGYLVESSDFLNSVIVSQHECNIEYLVKKYHDVDSDFIRDAYQEIRIKHEGDAKIRDYLPIFVRKEVDLILKKLVSEDYCFD